MTPLEAIHGPEVTFAAMTQSHAVEVLAGSVAVPDMHALGRERRAVRVARHEPEEFLNDAAREDALCGEQWQGVVRQREAQGGRGEERQCPRAGAVGARLACRDDARDEVQVLVLLCLLAGD